MYIKRPIKLIKFKNIISLPAFKELGLFLSASRVVCIDDKDRPIFIDEDHWIKEGNVYCISEAYTVTGSKEVTGIIPFEVNTGFKECPGYNIDRFKPIFDYEN